MTELNNFTLKSICSDPTIEASVTLLSTRKFSSNGKVYHKLQVVYKKNPYFFDVGVSQYEDILSDKVIGDIRKIIDQVNNLYGLDFGHDHKSFIANAITHKYTQEVSMLISRGIASKVMDQLYDYAESVGLLEGFKNKCFGEIYSYCMENAGKDLLKKYVEKERIS